VLSSEELRWCLILTLPFFLARSLVVISLVFFLRAAWALSAVAVTPKAIQTHSNVMVQLQDVGVDAWLRLEMCMAALLL